MEPTTIEEAVNAHIRRSNRRHEVVAVVAQAIEDAGLDGDLTPGTLDLVAENLLGLMRARGLVVEARA